MLNLVEKVNDVFINCVAFSMDNIKYLTWDGKCIKFSVQKDSGSACEVTKVVIASSCVPISSTNKTKRHYLIDISLKVAFSIHNPACFLYDIVPVQPVSITTKIGSSNPS